MKKFFVLLVILLTTFGLAACTDISTIGEIPEFNERNLVELSAQEMVELFENIEYSTTDTETMRMSIQGTFNVSDYYEGWGYTEDSVYEATLDVVVYARVAPQVADARLHAEGDIDFLSTVVEVDSWETPAVTTTSINGFAGSAAMYLIDQYLYVNVDGTMTEEGVEEEVSFKQKVSEQLSQSEWEEVYTEENVDEFDTMIPTEFTDLLESEDLDDLMDAIPNLKVYKDGQMYSIVFAIDKQGILDNLLDIIREMIQEMEPTATEDDIQEAYNEAVAEINAVVDELEVLYVITILDNKVTKVAMDINFVSESEEIEIDMTVVIDMNVELPKFPNDLDEYEVVDSPGEGILD